MIFHSQKVESYYLGIDTQLPGLRELDLEPIPKIGSDKINILKIGRKTREKNILYSLQSHIDART